MKALLAIAARSALNRRGTLALVVLSIALATALLLSLERLRNDIRASFSLAVSGTDLIVGARTGPVQLMLYAVFRVGGATNNITMDSVRAIAGHRAVARAMDSITSASVPRRLSALRAAMASKAFMPRPQRWS